MNYSLITLILVFCSFLVILEMRTNDSIKTLIYFSLVTLFSWIFALRNPNTSPDTQEYIRVFNTVSLTENWFKRIERFEPGYCFLNRAVKYFTNDYRYLFFVMAFCSFFLLFFSIKEISENYRKRSLEYNFAYSNNKFYPIAFLLIYIAYFGFLYNSIAIRQGLAIALIYASGCAVSKNKRVTSIMLIVCGCLVHQSAILAIPIVIIRYLNLKISKKVLIEVILILMILYLTKISSFTTIFIQDIVNMLYEHFPGVQLFWWSSQSIGTKEIIVGGYSLYRIFSYLIVLIIVACDQEDGKANCYSVIATIGLVIWTLFGGFSIVIRLSEYYLVGLCFSVYYLLVQQEKCIRLSMVNRQILIPKYFFVIFISCIYYYVYLRNVVFLFN